MIFEQIAVGGDRNFAYLVGCPEHKVAAVFDPAFNPSDVLDAVSRHGLELRYVVNTHGHSDHTNGNDDACRESGAKLVAHESAAGDPAIRVGHDQTLDLGSLSMRFIHTPGHTSDSICVLIDDVLITGDTLFVGKVGGTRFGDDAREEYESLHQKLMTLPDPVKVYPGHDYGVRPTSTIGDERSTNPFLIQPDVDAFIHLKRNWLQYKAEHGIK